MTKYTDWCLSFSYPVAGIGHTGQHEQYQRWSDAKNKRIRINKSMLRSGHYLQAIYHQNNEDKNVIAFEIIQVSNETTCQTWHAGRCFKVIRIQELRPGPNVLPCQLYHLQRWGYLLEFCKSCEIELCFWFHFGYIHVSRHINLNFLHDAAVWLWDAVVSFGCCSWCHFNKRHVLSLLLSLFTLTNLVSYLTNNLYNVLDNLKYTIKSFLFIHTLILFFCISS